MDGEERRHIRALLKHNMTEVEGVQLGDFTLASGQKSHYSVEPLLAATDPIGLACMAELILDMLHSDVVAIGGEIKHGQVIGAVMDRANRGEAPKHPCTSFLVKSPDRGESTGTRHVVGNVPRDAPVTFITDVTTTGGSTLEAIALFEKETGAKVIQVITLVNREFDARENLRTAGLPELEALFEIDELLPAGTLA